MVFPKQDTISADVSTNILHKQKLREPLYSMAGVAVIEIYSMCSIFIVNNA